jgi:hypothetical protein
MEAILTLGLGAIASIIATLVVDLFSLYFRRQGRKIEIQFDHGKRKETILVKDDISDKELLEKIKQITESPLKSGTKAT